MKRIQLLPLVLLLWCGGISLSSGLYFEDINVFLYLIPIALIMGIYYFLRFLCEDFKKKEFISFGGSFLLSLMSFAFLKKIIVPGLYVIMNTIFYRFAITYGITLRTFVQEGTGSVELAVSQIIALITAVTLYLYEKHVPAVVTALPSFVLFITSIAADGVPFEWCTVLYGAALIIFLGMGRRGGNVPRFLLLTVCTAATAVIVGTAFSWADLSEQMWEYRDRIATIGSGQGGSGSVHPASEEKKQIINFGQFNKDGNISYNGTIELRIKTEEAFGAEKLFLRGFIGTTYDRNEWDGFWMGSEVLEDTDDIFTWDKKIKIENVFDKGRYMPYSVNEDQYEELLDRPAGVSSSSSDYLMDGIWFETMGINSKIYDQIHQEIIQGKPYKTVKQAINIVKDYFGNDFQYSLSTGKVRSGVNEVEKFLFYSKKGYCTHFATSAVLIFRVMGIPARLAEGYMISGNKINPDETVDVCDYNAHAWVEIYIEEEGWMPLDVTSYVLGDLTQEMELTEEQRERIRQHQQEQKKQEDKKRKERKEKEEEEQEEEPTPTPVRAADGGGSVELWRLLQDWMKENVHRETAFAAILLLIVCGSGAAAAVIIRRRRNSEKIRREMKSGSYGARLLFVNDQLADFWREAGAPWNYYDSAAQAREIFQHTKKYYHLLLRTSLEEEKKEQVRQYVLSVYESRFGGSGIGEEVFAESMRYLEELLEAIRENTEKKKWKKFRKCSMVRVLEKEMEDKK